ncbi:methyltransferase domain-containing protein [Halomarina rubra]|uniref:Methyltransferase domain-containing protein n=1 Tax=Halomarina rubra TaxID=2071873 RepID=A0ABD6B0A1_9EURY|nr:methyltransferase domain-containing protein [Halomarina rubra]
MNDEQRRSVLDNARYLRQVRPVDPEEIYEYVAGTPHPAVVRQTLREAAFDLGLRERDDGTFVPASDDPVEARPGRVEAFPDEYAERLEDLLVERYGLDWHAGESGDRLRAITRRIKEEYYRQHPVEYDEETALAYALYHLPDNYAVGRYVVGDLVAGGQVPKTLRVLDVGAGVGGPALGLLDLLPDDAVVEYHAVEPSAAADVFEEVVDTGRNRHVEVHRETAEAFDPHSVLPGAEAEGGAGGDGGGGATGTRGFDLVVFANVLSELDDPTAVARRYADAVADDGTLVCIAPADKNTAIGLREVERDLEREGSADGADLTVYGPEVRLWSWRTPEDQGWSFDARPDLTVPDFQRRLDEATPDADADHAPGEFVNVDVQFASSLLRRDGRTRVSFSPDSSRFAPLAESEHHVTDRLDCVAFKLSGDLSEGNPLYRIGDGSQSVDHYAVCTRESALNRDLERAPYGALLSFENALLLWNDDEEAYNLVVDGETVVDRIA